MVSRLESEDANKVMWEMMDKRLREPRFISLVPKPIFLTLMLDSGLSKKQAVYVSGNSNGGYVST